MFRAGPKLLKQTLALLAIAALGTAWTAQFHPRRPTLYLAPPPPAPVPLSLPDLLREEPPPVLLDTRPLEAFSRGHLPGALSISPDRASTSIAENPDLFLDRRRHFVIYGPAEPSRALKAQLHDLGLSNVDLATGWESLLQP